MGIESDLLTPFARAVRYYGSQSAAARRIGMSQASVYQLLKSGKPVWPNKVLQIEADTGVSRHDLNPDVYPRESIDLPAQGGSLEPAR